MANQEYEQKGFIVYKDYIEWLDVLNTNQLGQLFQQMLLYINDRETPELKNQAVKLAWGVIRTNMERDSKGFQEASERKSIGRIVANLKAGHNVRPESIKKLKDAGLFTRRYFESQNFDTDLINEILQKYEEDT